MNLLTINGYIFIVLVIIILVLLILSENKKMHYLNKVASFLFGIVIIQFIINLLGFYLYLMAAVIPLTVYGLSKFILEKFLIKELAIYFSFVIDLIIIAYFLECFGSLLLKINKIIGKNLRYDIGAGYKKIVKLLKPKLWVYLFATIFTIIASIEGIIEINIISNNTWNEIKPYLFEAIVTFIVLDAFISLLISNKDLLKESKILLVSFLYDFTSFEKRKNE